jgi:hypothetical protein
MSSFANVYDFEEKKKSSRKEGNRASSNDTSFSKLSSSSIYYGSGKNSLCSSDCLNCIPSEKLVPLGDTLYPLQISIYAIYADKDMGTRQ